MNLMLRQLFARMNPHLSDEAISLLISGELSRGRIRRARKHLEACWKCRARHEQLEMAAMKFVEFDKQICLSIPPENPTTRRNLIRRIDELAAALPAPSYWTRLRLQLQFRLPQIPVSRLATVFVAVCFFTVLVTLWQRNTQTITASEFMQSAVAVDSSFSKVEGVVYQRVRIRSARGTIETALYRDLTGRRRQRKPAIGNQQALVYAKLEIAGIAWQDPLSPANFKNWHDRQNRVMDAVKRSGNGLLTLTTKVSNSIVSEESLTVREDTFHPVERTVDFKDYGPVEITELNYEILSLDAINKDLFEPPDDVSNSVHASVPSSVSSAISSFALPHLLSNEQLDEAELETQLELMKLHLDGNGQIEIVRGAKGIQVRGIVASEEDKRELEAQLHVFDHVIPIIHTEQEAASSEKLHSQITRISEATVTAEPAPLENYLAEHNWPAESRNRLSARIFQDALTADQAALVLTGLANRFSSANHLTKTAAAARGELIARHRQSLLMNIQDEEKTLAETEKNWKIPLPVSQNSTSNANIAINADIAITGECQVLQAVYSCSRLSRMLDSSVASSIQRSTSSFIRS